MNVGKRISRDETYVLKGIAILTVIIAHANGYSKSLVNVPILKDAIIASILCQGGMCLFLILSGYGLYSSYLKKGLYSFWDNKFNKIFIPAILVQSLWVLFVSVLHYVNSGNIFINWNTMIADLLCVSQENKIDGSIWYLSYLLFCYLCFYLVFNMFSNRNVAIIVFTIFWIISMKMMTYFWKYGFYCIASFLIGVWLSYIMNSSVFVVKMDGRIIKIQKYVYIILSIIIARYYYYNFRTNVFWDNIVSNIIALAFIVLCSILPISKMKILHFLGKYSFFIYLFQGKIIWGGIPYSSYSDNMRLMIFLILFVVNIIVAVLFSKKFERMRKKVKMDKSF